jgi:hypothetical protein
VDAGEGGGEGPDGGNGGGGAEGPGVEDEEESDPYSIRYRKFWQRGGLSGLNLDEHWGYTHTGEKRTNGIQKAEAYFNVLYEEDLGPSDSDAD